MRIISREEWGADPRSLPSSAMRLPATEVFIHHSVSTVTDYPIADMRSIERIGITRFGQFSYSYVIHPHDGEILEGCGLQRGAHTSQKNSTSFGICWAGNYEDRQPKVQQLDATRWLIAELTRQGHLVPGAPIRGHRDTGFATACPGSKLYAMLDVIRHPWEETVPDDPNLPNLPDIKWFLPIVGSDGVCKGYYIVSSDGQLHAFGPGAPFYGRSEVPS